MAHRMSVALVFAALFVAGVAAQGGPPDCTAAFGQLSPCLTYVTGPAPTPDMVCCSALTNLNTNNPTCLCLAVSQLDVNPTVNRTKALSLPRDCNVPVDTAACPALALPPPGMIPPVMPPPGFSAPPLPGGMPPLSIPPMATPPPMAPPPATPPTATPPPATPPTATPPPATPPSVIPPSPTTPVTPPPPAEGPTAGGPVSGGEEPPAPVGGGAVSPGPSTPQGSGASVVRGSVVFGAGLIAIVALVL